MRGVKSLLELWEVESTDTEFCESAGGDIESVSVIGSRCLAAAVREIPICYSKIPLFRPCSGGLEIVSGTKDLGDGSPQRAEPRWGLGAKPQKLTTYFENNYRKHRLMRPLY